MVTTSKINHFQKGLYQQPLSGLTKGKTFQKQSLIQFIVNEYTQQPQTHTRLYFI